MLKNYEFEAECETGLTSLHGAAKYGSIDTLKILLHNISDADFKNTLSLQDKNGKTVLHFAVAYSQSNYAMKEILDCWILKIGVDTLSDLVDVQNDDGETAAHGGARLKNAKSFDILV